MLVIFVVEMKTGDIRQGQFVVHAEGTPGQQCYRAFRIAEPHMNDAVCKLKLVQTFHRRHVFNSKEPKDRVKALKKLAMCIMAATGARPEMGIALKSVQHTEIVHERMCDECGVPHPCKTIRLYEVPAQMTEWQTMPSLGKDLL